MKKSFFNSAREKEKRIKKSMLDRVLFEMPTHISSKIAYLEDLRVLKEKLANYYIETLITKYSLVPCIIERRLVYDSQTLMSKMNALVRAQKRL